MLQDGRQRMQSQAWLEVAEAAARASLLTAPRPMKFVPTSPPWTGIPTANLRVGEPALEDVAAFLGVPKVLAAIASVLPTVRVQ